MDQQVTRAELLRRLERERARLEAVLAQLTPEQMVEPDVVGSWSVKDVLAHFIAHEQFALHELQHALRGKRMKPLPPSNAEMMMASRSQSLDAVRIAWDASYRQVVAAVEALSDADFDPSGPVVQVLDDTIDGALGNNTYGHYAEHLEQIEAWLLQRQS